MTIRSRDSSSSDALLGLGEKLLVLERDCGRSRCRLEQFGIVVERRVVHDRGDVAAFPLDRRDGAAGSRCGRRPVNREYEVGVAERAPECLLHVTGVIVPRPRSSSARPPRARRERNRPARKASGTRASEDAVAHTTAGVAGPAQEPVDAEQREHREREGSGEAR